MKWKVTPSGTVVVVPDIDVGADAFDTYEGAAIEAKRMLEQRIEEDREALKRLDKGDAT